MENTLKTKIVDNECSNKNSGVTNSSQNKILFKNEGYVSLCDKMCEKIRKKYAAVAEANRRVCHTDNEMRAYIWDKYFNKKSSRYVTGLSDVERHACYSNEYSETCGGGSYTFADPVTQKDALIPASIDIARKNQYNRNKINTQIADLFAENQISVPHDVTLRFTIEPKEYKLTVSGTEDEELKKNIERILNTDDNAKNIFMHMINIQDDNAGQFSEKKLSKYYMNKTVKEETGYDLDELALKDGAFYTEDGTNIYELLMKSIATQEMPKDVKSSVYYYYREQLNEVAKYYNVTDDLVLSIDYQNGSLYDVNQRKQYGVGQTQWISDMANDWKFNEY